MFIHIRRFAAILFIVLTAALLFLLSFFSYSIVSGKQYIQPAFNRPLLSEYTPVTGDIVAVHYSGHGMVGIPVAEHWPTHAGFVWAAQSETCIIECTKFCAPALPNLFEPTKDKDRGVRIVPWKEYVNSLDNVMYLRKYSGRAIEDSAVQEALLWAKDVNFEPRIAETMTFDVTVAIGFRPVWPKLTDWCSKAAKLDLPERYGKSAYCSEFVSQFLQKLGCMDPAFKDHYKVSPASILQSVGLLDKLSFGYASWGRDEMLVRRI
jgi:hypothetical protein